jgi:hypothetical protein
LTWSILQEEINIVKEEKAALQLRLETGHSELITSKQRVLELEDLCSNALALQQQLFDRTQELSTLQHEHELANEKIAVLTTKNAALETSCTECKQQVGSNFWQPPVQAGSAFAFPSVFLHMQVEALTGTIATLEGEKQALTEQLAAAAVGDFRDDDSAEGDEGMRPVDVMDLHQMGVGSEVQS